MRLFDCSISVEIIGDALEPEEISLRLGASPTRSFRKGEPTNKLNPSGSEKSYATGYWSFSSSRPSDAGIDELVESLLHKLSGDLEIWRQLASQFRTGIVCDLSVDYGHETFHLSPETVQHISARQLGLRFLVSSAPRPGSLQHGVSHTTAVQTS